MRYRAEIRSRRSLRYSGADFVMEKSCYSILINNGGRARYGGENFKRASCPCSRIKLNLATKEIERKRERKIESARLSQKIRAVRNSPALKITDFTGLYEAPTLPFGGLRLFNLQEKWPQSARLTVAGYDVGDGGRGKRRYFTINIRPISCTQSRCTIGGRVKRIFIFVSTRNLWLTNGRSSFCLEIAR